MTEGPGRLIRLVLGVLALSAVPMTAQRAGVPPGSAPMPSGTATISGRVVDSQTSAPVAGATVRLQVLRAAPVGANQIPYVPMQITAAADGSFTARDLPNAPVTIQASASGYSPGQYRSGAGTSVVQLADGESLSGVIIRLDRLGRISGTVRDERGRPVARIAVQVLHVIPSTTSRTYLSQSGPLVTDAEGRFAIGDLPAATYLVMVPVLARTTPASVVEAANRARTDPLSLVRRAFDDSRAPIVNGVGIRLGEFIVATTSGPSGWPVPLPESQGDGSLRTYRTTFYPAARTIADATEIAVGASATVDNIDVRLVSDPVGVVTGKIVRANGSPGYLAVRLMSADSDALSSLSDTESAVTIADETGAFSFFQVPQGHYTARAVIAPGGPSMATVSLYLQSWAEGAVDVGGTPAQLPSLTLRDPLTISGDIQLGAALPESNAGRILTQMSLRSLRWSASLSRPVPVTGPGHFTMTAGLPGPYDLLLPGTGWYFRSITLAGRDLTQQPIELATDNISSMQVTLTTVPTRVTFFVHDAANLAAPDAVVIIFPTTPPPAGTPYSPRASRMLRSPPTGRLNFGGMPPGEYYFAAYRDPLAPATALGAPLLWPDERSLETLRATAVRVKLVEGANADVDLLVRPLR